MTINPVYFDEQNHSIQDGLIEGKTSKEIFLLMIRNSFLLDFRFEPYMSHLRNGDFLLPSMTTNRIEPPLGDIMALPP